MPKEYVHGEGLCLTSEDAAKEFKVAVGWSRADVGGHVQVATVRHGDATTSNGWDGMYVDLDRTGINDLIRLLRKARDQAFGRDE